VGLDPLLEDQRVLVGVEGDAAVAREVAVGLCLVNIAYGTETAEFLV
jgi:hypothetical protein